MKLIKFGADWCSTCKLQDEILKRLDGIEIYPIDIDQDYDGALTEKYGIKTLPTMIIVDNENKVLYKFIGLKQENEIKEVWNSLEE